jgi:ferredoxin, 2Fe-2S
MPRIKVTTLAGAVSELDAKSGNSLMEELRDNGYDEILAICGGVCSCSSCHVYIDNKWLSMLTPPRKDEEQLVKSTDYYRENSRLSCQITLTDEMDGMQVTIAEQAY